MTRPWSAPDLVDLVVDDDGVDVWDDEVRPTDPLAFVDTRSYAARLAAAAETDVTEAVLTGSARVGGRDVAVLVGAYEFLAGTQGMVVGERIARAFDRAAQRRLPVVAMPASGGTRMQEGTPAFVQMLKVAASVAAFRRAGGRLVAWLRHPTMGGVLASWASLAHVTWAQPGALVGLTGPRVIAAVDGAPLPPHVQRAEHLARHGVIDDIVAADDLRARLAEALHALGGPSAAQQPASIPRSAVWPAQPVPRRLPTGRPGPTADGWTSVERSRAADRPGLRALLERAAHDILVLHGDGAGGRDDSCVTLVCAFRSIRAMVIGHDRRPGERGASLGAVGYRTARRAMAVAAQMGLPVICVIDTRGAAATIAAESGGVAREIATGMAMMSLLDVPTVAVLLGEGSGGGAIAWLAADRVVAAEHAWLAPISPEGASAILYRSTDRAADLARAQALDVRSLQAIGVLDRVVAEDAGWPAAVADAVAEELAGLMAQSADVRLAARARRLRSLGAASA